jgi:hypothetical protein
MKSLNHQAINTSYSADQSTFFMPQLHKRLYALQTDDDNTFFQCDRQIKMHIFHGDDALIKFRHICHKYCHILLQAIKKIALLSDFLHKRCRLAGLNCPLILTMDLYYRYTKSAQLINSIRK